MGFYNGLAGLHYYLFMMVCIKTSRRATFLAGAFVRVCGYILA
jgi:hypothetical protein